MQYLFLIKAIFFSAIVFFALPCSSQNKLKVTVRAGNGAVYFYHKGIKTDSIIHKKNAFFYLLCKASQKKNILIHVENARLVPDENDSLVFAEYLPGLKYEAWFMNSKDSLNSDGTIYPERIQLHSFLNGTSSLDRNQIRVQIFMKKENELIFDQIYTYKD